LVEKQALLYMLITM